MKRKVIISWLLRVVAAAILLQTLYFKFSAHPESVALFTKLGVEPWGRIATGVIELITSILLLVPSTIAIGAFLGVGVMAGAILSHIMVIGIQSQGDDGQLFMLAIIVMACCLLLLIIEKQQLILYSNKLLRRKNTV